MSAPRKPQPPLDALSVSATELRRLLSEKERETDLRLAHELHSRCAQLRFQELLGERMGQLTDLCELGALILAAARDELGVPSALLAIVTESQFLEVVASSVTPAPRYQIDCAEEAFIVGETLHFAGDDAEALLTLGSDPLPAGVPLLAIPLFRQDGKPLGVLLLEGALAPERVDWLEGFLSLVTLALQDCLHYNGIEHLLDDAAVAIAHDHENLHPDQAGHCRRVAGLARDLGLALGMGASELKRLRWVALLHDLAPEAIMRAFGAMRRGKHTRERWQALMAEPFVAGVFASPLADFQRALEQLRFLRCRFDGKGNQPPVDGVELPYAVRIVAVAEAFEHLTGSRGNRTTLSVPDALAQISRYAGSLYDPAVVDALRAQFPLNELEHRISFLPDAD